MNVLRLLIAGCVLMLSGCATMQEIPPQGPDQTGDAFFNYLQRNKRQAAYDLFARGLTQAVSYDQFDRFMEGLQEHWGPVDYAETVVMPFHQRVGDGNFIPLNVTPEQVKRYIYQVTFERAEMNFDLTLAPEDGTYKIVWFSIWGSNIYLTPEIQALIEELFAGTANPSLQQ